MDFSMEFFCVLFLRILCLSQGLEISNLESVESSSSGERNDNNLNLQKILASRNVLPTDFQDFSVMDATEGTTPAVCTPGMTCGFQQYEQDIKEYHYFPFVPYCRCPVNYECAVAGQNMRGRFFYYTCQYVTLREDSTVEVTEISTFNFSGSSSSINTSTISTSSVSAIENKTETESPELRDRVGFMFDIHEL